MLDLSFSDELAERSARGAFKIFLADDKVDLLRQVVDSSWIENLPKTRAAADTGATEYEFEFVTHLEVSTKDIEAVLPAGLHELNENGQIFIWKSDDSRELSSSKKYSIKIFFQTGSRKRDRILDELKAEHNKKQHRVDSSKKVDFGQELLLV